LHEAQSKLDIEKLFCLVQNKFFKWTSREENDVLQRLTNPDVPGTIKKMERDKGVTKIEGFRDQRK
jgi:hypothetical protein